MTTCVITAVADNAATGVGPVAIRAWQPRALQAATPASEPIQNRSAAGEEVPLCPLAVPVEKPLSVRINI